ncbi:MAG TPA: AI-2E family transporter [Actinocrinis sp.]|nr:AI-2E family transporter [Actinocrinis sp.]
MDDKQAGPARLAGSLGQAAQRASRALRTARAARAGRGVGPSDQAASSRGARARADWTDRAGGTGAGGPGGDPARSRAAVGRTRVRIAGSSRPRSAGAPAPMRGGSRSRKPIEAVLVPPVPRPLAVSAAYAWRLLIVAVAIYVVFMILLRFELVFIALFLALVFSSLLRPCVKLLSRVMPRSLAVLITLLGSVAALAALFWGVGVTVTDDSTELTNDFRGGLARIQKWLQGPPFRIHTNDLTGLQQKLTSFISTHQATLINQVVNEAGKVAEIFTVLALSVFCSIFFLHSGERMWRWFQDQLPQTAQPAWDQCARAAWRTFAGYARGTIIIAGTNAVLVGISLYVIGVPLALPLTVLEFFLSFIPLAGSPIAMAVATVVALAGRGPTAAVIVLILIVVIGQIEGHVLQPLVMGWSVRLHPVAVALSVISGGIVAGFLGAVVAVPLVSIVWAVMGEIRRIREEPTLEEVGPPIVSV